MEYGNYSGLAYQNHLERPEDLHSHPLRRQRSEHFESQHHPPPFNQFAHLACDVKPRLTKEQHDILEAEFQKQSKPNTNTKKSFAEMLGVSLDKVNNWFQNRRAKSKQDAKKQAGAFNLLQASQPGGVSLPFADHIPPAFCAPDFSNAIHGAAFMDGPLTGGQGMGQLMVGQNPRMIHDSVIDGFPGGRLADSGMHLAGSMGQDFSHDDSNRRTLTQEQFDALAQGGSFLHGTSGESMDNELTGLAPDPGMLSDYFPELCNFSFPEQPPEALGSQPMQHVASTDSYTTDGSTFSAPPSMSAFAPADNVPRGRDLSGAGSEWSDGSNAPSVHLTPATQVPNPFELTSPPQVSQPATTQAATTTAQWQPGQSVPADFAAYDREFKELKMRTQSISTQSNSSGFVEEPLAFPADDAFGRRESSVTTMLSQGVHNIGISSEPRNPSPTRISGMPSSGIAARRQRPRPAPLGQAALRSTSFCGPLPPSPGPGHTQNLAAGAQTLRRIKSNNVMNGIASGRIQKNSCSSAQRSPLNFSFAEAANRSPYRRASAFAGMPSSASLAPPTPLSPSEYPRAESQRAWPPWQNQGHVSRQPSISESESESVSQFLASNNASNNNFGSSPPTTPLYPSNLMRSRLGSMVINENTPPQSAPATQQSFSNTSFAQHQAQIQQPAQSVPVLQSQSQTMVPAMPNEYPQMPNVVFPMQQFQVPVSGPFMEMPMPYAAQAPMMVNTANMPMNYGAMPFMQSPMSAQPGGGPNMPQYPFVPSSTPGQNVLVSASVPKQQAPSGSDLFIHEYSPPQSIKQSATPRRTADSNSGPKSYQFANSGPEHYEKGKAKQEQQASSPSSSAGGSTASS